MHKGNSVGFTTELLYGCMHARVRTAPQLSLHLHIATLRGPCAECFMHLSLLITAYPVDVARAVRGGGKVTVV